MAGGTGAIYGPPPASKRRRCGAAFGPAFRNRKRTCVYWRQVATTIRCTVGAPPYSSHTSRVRPASLPARGFFFVLDLFLTCAIRMPDDEKLTPADPDEVAAALAFALQFEGR